MTDEGEEEDAAVVLEAEGVVALLDVLINTCVSSCWSSECHGGPASFPLAR